jgi:hypothetical protein
MIRLVGFTAVVFCVHRLLHLCMMKVLAPGNSNSRLSPLCQLPLRLSDKRKTYDVCFFLHQQQLIYSLTALQCNTDTRIWLRFVLNMTRKQWGMEVRPTF